MRLLPDDDSGPSPEGQKQSPPRKYQLSGYRLIVIVFVATVAGGLLALSDIPGYLKANYVLVRHPEAFSALFAENDFDEIRLDVKFKHFRKIEQKRQEALKRDLLISSDDDFVPGNITVAGNTFDCKLRLKGDLSDHWSGHKWSLRVQLKDDAFVFGMSRFSLQDPVTRGHTGEWMFLESLRREGLLAVRYRFVNLTLNGKLMGVYAMEEHFSKELIESQGRREGVIVSFDENRLWQEEVTPQGNVDWGSVYQAANLQPRNSKRVGRSPVLQKQKVAALNLLRGLQEKELEGDEVFASDRLGRFLAISRLWGAERGLLFADINFFFDPITGRLEPIGFDGNPGTTVQTPYCYFSWGDIPDNWVNQALRSPRIAKAYIKHLDLFTRPNYLAKLRGELEAKELRIRRLQLKDLFMEEDNAIWKSDASLLQYDPWNLLEHRATHIRLELAEEQPAMSYARPMEGDSASLEVIVRNALTQPIEIIGFEKGDRHWTAKETLHLPDLAQLDPTGKTVVMPLQRFGHTSFDGDHHFILDDYLEHNSSSDKNASEGLYLLARILGMENRPLRLPVPIDSSRFRPEKLPFRANRESPVSIHSFLQEEDDVLVVLPGEHKVTEDLIIPPNRSLLLPAGTILLFAPEATLVSESPIRALGTEEYPVILTASNATWPGLLIANAKERSEFRHVRISKMAGVGSDANPKGIDRGGWTLTGGITFHHSPVDISHCHISNGLSEDALNIIASDFTLRDSVFSDISSDAFDGDFVKGSITNCTFERIGGDAIDLSGSNVTIEKIRVFETADKALSAGEDSRVTLSKSLFEDIGFGIASKDFSDVRAFDVHIKRAKVAALAAYQKKNVFGPAKIMARGLQVTETAKTHLIQKGSSAEIDGQSLQQIDLDIDSLYREEPLTP